VDALLPHDGKSMLDAFDEEQRADELRQIAENGGRWPTPKVEGAADGHSLSIEQANWLLERLFDHPGRTVSEPAVMSHPLAEQHATYITCSIEESDDVATLRKEPKWSFRILEVGHWPMVAAPGRLVALLDEVTPSRQTNV